MPVVNANGGTVFCEVIGSGPGAPRDSWAMWNGIPRAVLVALNGVGHDWFVEAPQVGAPLIRSFLRGDFDPPYE